MKTTTVIAVKQAILIFTLLIGLQIQHVMAKSPANSDPVKNAPTLSTFVPVTSKAASSVDFLPESTLNINAFAPSVPKEASIDYENPNEISPELLKNLAPSTPAEADINDSTLQLDVNINAVKFHVPCKADSYIF
jgi:hypothetical protein